MVTCARTKARRLLLIAASLALATVASTAAEAQAPRQTAPGASSRGEFPAFVLTRGRYVPFEAADPRVQLFPTGINNRGEIVGEYIIASSKESILLRDRRGRITSFDVPGAKGTEASDINDRGQIVGTFSEDTPIVNNSARPRGFLLDRGKLTTIDFPGAALTVAAGVNNRGQVVGGYLDAQGRPHGYRWDNGRFTTIEVPGASGTMAGDVNDRGEMIGVVGTNPDDPRGTMGSRGFLLRGGIYYRFAIPGVAFTQPTKINNRGQIVGFTATSASGDPTQDDLHGFLLRTGIYGAFTPIDFPGAPITVAFGINDRGQIVGAYQNPAAVPNGQRSPMRMPMMMSRR